MIVLADTIVQPYAMMVHSLDATLALPTVPDPDVFHIFAFLAVLNLIHKEFVLELP